MVVIEIRSLSPSPEVCGMLGEMLLEAVRGGGSLSFLDPLDPGVARSFWEGMLAAAERGDQVIFGAWEGDLLVGTVTLVLKMPQNQSHRGEMVKVMTRASHRGRGVAAGLMRAAEQEAAKRGKTLLVLDTATIDGAAGFYEGLGYRLAGVIPDFSLLPHGGLTGTMIYWKRLAGWG
jgi:GNAT superfamily N-acetyltransferase